MNVLEHLKEGHQNAIKANELKRLLGMDSRRAVAKQVEALRKEGYLIASCNDGYFIAVTDEEIEKFYYNLEKRALSMFRVRKCFRKEMQKRQLDTGKLRRKKEDSGRDQKEN